MKSSTGCPYDQRHTRLLICQAPLRHAPRHDTSHGHRPLNHCKCRALARLGRVWNREFIWREIVYEPLFQSRRRQVVFCPVLVVPKPLVVPHPAALERVLRLLPEPVRSRSRPVTPDAGSRSRGRSVVSSGSGRSTTVSSGSGSRRPGRRGKLRAVRPPERRIGA